MSENMEIALIIIVFIIAVWFWVTRRADKFTTRDFDEWLYTYKTTASHFKRPGMAVAFLAQSIHLALVMGIINSKQKDVITSMFKNMGAINSVDLLLDHLSEVDRATGANSLANMPARSVGALLLIAWMAPIGEGENAVRCFISN